MMTNNNAMTTKKEQMLAEIDGALKAHIAEVRKSVQTSQEMTRDAPGRIESRYDTSREETGWLATGQSVLLGELENGYAAFKAMGNARKSFVQPGAYFEADSLLGGPRVRCLVCNGGGGMECDTSLGKVMLVSTSSPMVVAAMGLGKNDIFTVNGRVDYVIREVA